MEQELRRQIETWQNEIKNLENMIEEAYLRIDKLKNEERHNMDFMDYVLTLLFIYIIYSIINFIFIGG